MKFDTKTRLYTIIKQILHNRLRLALILLTLLPITGTLGYMLIEGWSFLDALFMTTITMSTIGYGETLPLSTAGRVFTIFFIISGVGSAAYSLTILAESVLRPELITNKLLERKLRSMTDHYIICGYGRSGSRIAQELQQLGKSCVVVEHDETRAARVREENIPVVIGDATDEETLKKAGIERARGLVTALDNDAANIFVVLTARGMNPKLYIVARADQYSTQTKLKRAGADAVLSPFEIGAVRMTHMLLQQNVIDSFELVSRKIAIDVSVKEIYVRDFPDFVGKTIEDLGIRRKFNVLMLAIKKGDESIEFPPNLETVLTEDMSFIVVGASDDLLQLQPQSG